MGLSYMSKLPNKALELIKKIGARLSVRGAEYYTCHCTGHKAYSILKTAMYKNIQYLATGSVVYI
jgi:7,8-dihydropterin-6-yl-methyl-4-(beta-D-ribofuranosyl)aminobenzene 5'-phosphate synthase